MYITGEREPVYLEPEEARMIDELLADIEVSPDTPVAIENVWSGKKKHIKYIKYPRPEKSYPDDFAGNLEPMDKATAEQFEKRIYPYQLECELAGFGTSKWPVFYMQSQGAVRIELSEKKKVHGFPRRHHLVEVVTDPNLYHILQKEVARYYLFLDRKQYAEKKRLEELEALAAQV